MKDSKEERTKMSALFSQSKILLNDDLSTWVIEGEKMNSTENKKMQLFMYSAIPARDLTEEERKKMKELTDFLYKKMGKEGLVKELRQQAKCIKEANKFDDGCGFYRVYCAGLLGLILISLIGIGFRIFF